MVCSLFPLHLQADWKTSSALAVKCAANIIERMRRHPVLPNWSIALPVLAWLVFAGQLAGPGGWYGVLLTLALLGSVIAAVHHAEVVAHRVGEPYGTLVLAVAITVIEVALIVSLMLAGGPATAALARDTVFAAVMIILNGMVGLCLLVGGLPAPRAALPPRWRQHRAGHTGGASWC